MSTLEQSDAEAAAVSTHPRASLADIEAAIVERFDINGFEAAQYAILEQRALRHENHPLCLLVMKNGFTIVGKSAPASPENFNAEFGKKLAYDDCIRQLWPLMGFALRDRLSDLGRLSDYGIHVAQSTRKSDDKA